MEVTSAIEEQLGVSREQIERFLRVFIWLANYSPEFKSALTKVFAKPLRIATKNLECLTGPELRTRILKYGPHYFKYKGSLSAVAAAEIMKIFPEYSRLDIKRMLIENLIYIKETQKKDPLTDKWVRCYVLDL